MALRSTRGSGIHLHRCRQRGVNEQGGGWVGGYRNNSTKADDAGLNKTDRLHRGWGSDSPGVSRTLRMTELPMSTVGEHTASHAESITDPRLLFPAGCLRA